MSRQTSTSRSVALDALSSDSQGKMTEITGLLCCDELQSLWVSECKLRQMSGLCACTNLINLHLSSNSIMEITGIKGLTNLQVGLEYMYGSQI